MKIAPCMLCIVVIAQAYSARADDWPHWMGPRMDDVLREKGLIDKFPADGPKIEWRAKIGPGYTGPSVVGNRVFLMDRTKDDRAGDKVENDVRKFGMIPGGERVVCLDATDGHEIWSRDYDCPYKIAYPTGPRCTPSVVGDQVYTLGAMGDLRCWNVETGDLVWEKKLTEQYKTRPPVWGYASHPLIDGQHLIVPVGGEGSAVVCFDRMTGEEIWKALTSSDVAYAPLVMYQTDAAHRQLIFWHGDGVDSLNPETGEHYWHVVFPEKKMQAAATSIITPQIVGDQLLVSEYYKGTLLLEIGSNPPSVKEVYRTNREDPEHKHSINALMTTPVIRDGYVYGMTGDGDLRCVRLADNAMQWTLPTLLGKKAVEFGTLFIVENEGRYFIFDDAGELIIGKFSPTEFTEIDRAKVLEPTGAARGRKIVWSHPAFSNGKMFARNDNEIVCVNLKRDAN